MTTRTPDPRCAAAKEAPGSVPEGSGLDVGRSELMRLLVVAATGCGMVGLTVSGLLTPVWTAIGLVAVAAAAALAYAWSAPPGQIVRKAASVAVLLLVALIMLLAGAPSLDQMFGFLAKALVGLCVAHTLVQERDRDLAFGLGTAALMLVLAAGTAPGMSLAVPLLLGCGVIVAGGVVLHGDHQARSAHEAARPAHLSPKVSPLLPLVRALATVAVVGVVLLLLVPTPDGSSLRSRLASGGPGQPEATGGVSRGVASYSSGSLDLRVRGPLPDDPIVFVPSDSPSLWRGTVYDTYENGTWLSTPFSGTGSLEEIRQGVALVPAPADGGTQLSSADDQGSWAAYPVAATDLFAGVVVAPGRPVVVQARGPVVDSAGGLQIWPGADAHGFPYLMDNPQVTYVVETMPIPAVQEVSADGRATRPDGDSSGLPDVWTQVPASVPDRVLLLGQDLVAGADSTAAAVADVESYVRHNALYTLDSPVTPAGEDVVDDFLFKSRLGFCEHFASAEAILLRAGGIPARVVTGFSSEPGPTDDGWRPLRADQAHAWVEAWVPGVGWVSSDPTAGAALAPASSSLTSSLVTKVGALLDSAAERVEAALILLALVLAGWGARTGLRQLLASRRNPERASVSHADRPEPEPLPAFRRLESALVAAHAGRGPAETVAELARRVPYGSIHQAAFTTVDETAYAARAPSDARAREAAQQLDALTARTGSAPRTRKHRRRHRR